MNREQVIGIWACSGIKDFFLSFCLSKTFHFQKPFFYHQGLEKLCKAYILAIMSSEYEDIPEKKSKEKIDSIVRRYGHNLVVLINKLIEEGVFEETILTKKWYEFGDYTLTGEDIAKLLKDGYTECRYPVINHSHERYPMPNTKGKGHWVPLHSSDPCDFAYNLGQILNERIEREFKVSTFDIINNYTSIFNHDDWVRFCRIFYKRELKT